MNTILEHMKAATEYALDFRQPIATALVLTRYGVKVVSSVGGWNCTKIVGWEELDRAKVNLLIPAIDEMRAEVLLVSEWRAQK
jgi:hypothetical protein